MSHRPSRLIPLYASLLAGCALTPLGESDYQCPFPDGAGRCQSVLKTYQETVAGAPPALATDVPAPTTDQPAADEPRPGFTNQNGDRWWQFLIPRDPLPPAPPPPLAVAPTPVPAPVVALAPATPDALLTPARVLRVWVAPFQDDQGDLHAPGLVYTEVVPRRWVLGFEAPPASVVLTPLQVDPPREAAITERGGRAGRPGQGPAGYGPPGR